MRPAGWGLWGRLGRVTGMSGAPLRPEQQMNVDELEQEQVNQILAKDDARYDAMTDEEREKYYVKPSRITRFKKFFRGD
jgi:hypothetical protein